MVFGKGRDGPDLRTIRYRDIWITEGTRCWTEGPEWPNVNIEFVLGIDDTTPPRLVITELKVTPREGGPPITSTLLRKIKTPQLIAAAVAEIWEKRDPDDYTPLWEHIRSKRGQGRILSDEQLSEVAALYRANPGHATFAVKEHFKLARSTAGDYIKRARDAGLLED
jgi:hypothetical protein